MGTLDGALGTVDGSMGTLDGALGPVNGLMGTLDGWSGVTFAERHDQCHSRISGRSSKCSRT